MGKKSWFITGASTGLGREYTLAALRRGDNVAAASIDPENMQDYTEEFGDSVLVQRLDVTDKNSVESCWNEAVRKFGYIDVCVNNAGFMQCGAIEEMTEAEARGIFECNFFGTFFVTQKAAAHMRERRSGTIIQTSSLSAIDTIAAEGMYGATKHAVLGMSEALYHELKPFGVHVVILEPGPIKTQMAKRAKLCKNRIHEYDEVLASELDRWGVGDYAGDVGDPKGCAKFVLKLADSENPPQHAIFTTFAVDIYRMSSAQRIKEAEDWMEDIKGTDLN